MRTWAVVAVLCASRVVVAKPVSLTIPSTTAKPRADHAGALVVARVDDGWRLVDAAKIKVEKGSVLVPDGRAVSPQEVASRAAAAGVLVVAGGKTPMNEVNPLAFALRNECWTFAAVHADAIVGLWSAACPPPAVEGPKDKRRLALLIEQTALTVGARVAVDANGALPQPPELFTFDQLAKARGGADSLVFATADDVLVETVVDALARVQREVPATQWVPKEWLPMRFPNGFGADPQPPPPPPQPRPTWQPPRQVTVTLGKIMLSPKSPYAEDEVGRVVRARAGVYRACYQRELNRKPGLKGTLQITFEIGPEGNVMLANAKGNLEDNGVQTCVRANVMRLKFAPKGAQTSVRAAFTFTSP